MRGWGVFESDDLIRNQQVGGSSPSGRANNSTGLAGQPPLKGRIPKTIPKKNPWCLGVRFRPGLCENSNPFFQVGVQYHYLPKTNMSSQLGTVAGLLLKAKWEKFLALREISEFSHSLDPLRTLRMLGVNDRSKDMKMSGINSNPSPPNQVAR